MTTTPASAMKGRLLDNDSDNSDYGAASDATNLLTHDALNKDDASATDYASHPVLKHLDREDLEATHETKCYSCGVPGFVLLCVFLTALSSVLLGYDIGVMAGAKLKIRKDFDLSDNKVELLVGILNFVSAFGGLFSGKLSDKIGRKKSVGVASCVFLGGAALMAFAPNYNILLLGRIVTGIGVGVGLTIAPLYSAELSPKKVRGALVSFTEVAINIGILLGFLAGWAFASMPLNQGWRWMLGVGGIPPAIILVALMIMPESPRWLVKHGYSDQAVQVLLKTCSPDEAFDTLIQLEEEAKIPTGTLSDMIHPTPTLRKLLVAGLGAAFFQQASGIEALVYYVPEVLDNAGIHDESDQLLANAGVGLVKVLFILIAMCFADKRGRRFMLFISSAGMLLADVMVAISFMIDGGAPITIAGVCSYMAMFSVGWGPICWVIVSEMFPMKVRGMAAGTGTFINRVLSGTIAMSYLSLSKLLTESGIFFLFAGVNLLAIIFVFTSVPETKGRSLEEIEADVASRKGRSLFDSCRKNRQVGFTHVEAYEVFDTHANGSKAQAKFQDFDGDGESSI
eukprot:TRINITY_DN12272_c0_g1_i1.p1 TRINITY_DN12272_c0_g1~~TRINITY_DN12272_c0_g1_i1.p1  ORF type:complete len:568 (+),score=125.53 TRINITY_DN12272_c0_g1_i1:1928-3631(+)